MASRCKALVLHYPLFWTLCLGNRHLPTSMGQSGCVCFFSTVHSHLVSAVESNAPDKPICDPGGSSVATKGMGPRFFGSSDGRTPQTPPCCGTC